MNGSFPCPRRRATAGIPALVLLMVTLTTALWAQTPGPVSAGAGTVAGTVLHGVTGEPVADAEVAFLMSGQDGQLAEVARQPVDADGGFSFSGPFLSAGQAFVLVAFYLDIPYPSASLEVGQQGAILLEVFEFTERSDDVSITAHHHFLSVDADGIDAAQLVQIENRGDASYVGHGTGHDRHVTEFILPVGLINLEDHNSALHQPSEGRYFDTQPLVPGSTQIAFSFRLPADSFDGHYVHQVIYPTESVDFYVQPPTIEAGPPFEDLGEVQVHDRSYRHLRLRDLVPGQSVRLPLPVDRPIRWVIKWVVLALGAVAGAAAAIVVAGRAASSPPPAPSQPPPLAGRATGRRPSPGSAPGEAAAPGRRQLEARRRAVLDELARLGDADAARREELMSEAVSLYRDLERGR